MNKAGAIAQENLRSIKDLCIAFRLAEKENGSGYEQKAGRIV